MEILDHEDVWLFETLGDLGVDQPLCLRVAELWNLGKWQDALRRFPVFAKSFAMEVGNNLTKETDSIFGLPVTSAFKGQKSLINILIKMLVDTQDAYDEFINSFLDHFSTFLEAEIGENIIDDDSCSYRSTRIYERSLTINGIEVIKWSRAAETEVSEPIYLSTNETDLADASDDYKTPEFAKYLIEKLDLEDSDSTPVAPDISGCIPQPLKGDEKGDYAVYVEEYVYDKEYQVKGRSWVGGYNPELIEEMYLVQYGHSYDAREAYDIAQKVVKDTGEDDRYQLWKMERLDDEELVSKRIEIEVRRLKLKEKLASGTITKKQFKAGEQKLKDIEESIHFEWKDMEE